MKKFLLSILLVLVFAGNCFSGTCVSQGGGATNWSDTATWGTTCSGGGAARIPAAGDTVEIATTDTVTFDVATDHHIPATGTLTSLSCTGAGQVTVAMDGNACHGAACEIRATTITGGTSTTGCISTTGSQTDHELLIVGDINGGTTGIGLYHNSAGIVRVTGNITAGSGSGSHGGQPNAIGAKLYVSGNVKGSDGNAASYGIRSNASSQVITVVNTTGGALGHGIHYIQNTGSVTISGTATGGGTTSASNGFFHTGTGTGTVNNAVGGTAYNSAGVASSGGVITITGNIEHTLTASGANGRITYSPAAETNYVKYNTTEYGNPVNLTVGNVKSGTKYGTLTGTLTSGGSGAWGF